MKTAHDTLLTPRLALRRFTPADLDLLDRHQSDPDVMRYATEMSIRLLRYGFGELGIERIAGITDLANVDSQRVLLKAGLVRDGERIFAHPSYGGEPLAWFDRDAASWLAERGDA
jgi:RimJ/RimL family protein N-acetyltransferase